MYDTNDPDACRTVLTLTAGDTLTLVELLGASRATESLAAMQQQIAGLTIDPARRRAVVAMGGPVARNRGGARVRACRSSPSCAAARRSRRRRPKRRCRPATVLSPLAARKVSRNSTANSPRVSGIVFLELGAVIFGLAILARIADRFELSPIPFYLVAGLFR